jgi:hypothetical protein
MWTKTKKRRRIGAVLTVLWLLVTAAIAFFEYSSKSGGVFVVQDGPWSTIAAGNKFLLDDCTTVRIPGQSLTSITRQAHAETVEIGLIRRGPHLILSVHEDGSGIAADRGTGSFWLVSMRERATALGGPVKTIGGPGLGTNIRVDLPLDLPVSAEAGI